MEGNTEKVKLLACNLIAYSGFVVVLISQKALLLNTDAILVSPNIGIKLEENLLQLPLQPFTFLLIGQKLLL